MCVRTETPPGGRWQSQNKSLSTLLCFRRRAPLCLKSPHYFFLPPDNQQLHSDGATRISHPTRSLS